MHLVCVFYYVATRISFTRDGTVDRWPPDRRSQATLRMSRKRVCIQYIIFVTGMYMYLALEILT